MEWADIVTLIDDAPESLLHIRHFDDSDFTAMCAIYSIGSFYFAKKQKPPTGIDYQSDGGRILYLKSVLSFRLHFLNP